MRFTVVPKVFCIFLAATGIVVSEPGRSTEMTDPVFGITYDTRTVHFEEVPARVANLCRRLREERFWIYAYVKTTRSEYLVVSSIRSRVSGGAVLIDGSACTFGLPDWLLYGIGSPGGPGDEVIGDKVRSSITGDLLHRYEVAFGGKRRFLDAVKRDGLAPSELPAVFRRRFEAFASR
jgi:hypothetical protein